MKSVPKDFLAAENAARLILAEIGVPTDDVTVSYKHLNIKTGWLRSIQGDLGVHLRNRIVINLDGYPGSIESLFHEFYHHGQQELEGARSYEDSYYRYPSGTPQAHDSNPYEKEAKLVASRIYDVWKVSSASFFYKPEKFARDIARQIPKIVQKDVTKIWAAEPEVTPQTRQRIEALKSGALLRPEPQQPARRWPWQHDQRRVDVRAYLRTQAADAGRFAAAYLLKEGFNAVETGDPTRVRKAAETVATPDFWRGVGVFTAASTGASASLDAGIVSRRMSLKTLKFAKTAAGLTAGMAAVQVLSGHADVRTLAVSTGSYLSATALLGLPARSIDPILERWVSTVGTPGKIAAGAYTVTKLALMLWVGEKIERAANDEIESGSVHKGIENWFRGVTGGAETQ